MNDQMKYHRYYEKFMKMELSQSIVKIPEYSNFSEYYPYIAESIRLKRIIKRLENKLKSEKVRSSKFKINRELDLTKTKLKKNNLFKRLHGESKQEAIFQRRYKLQYSRMRFSTLAGKYPKKLGQKIRKLWGKLRRLIHKNLPPSLFNLRELNTAEKGLALREWLQEKRKKIR